MHIRSRRASELRRTRPHQTPIVGRRTRSARIPSSGVGIILTTIPIRTVVVEIPTPRALRRIGHAVPSRTRLRLGRGSGKNSRTQENRTPKKYLRQSHALSVPHSVPNEKIHSPRCQESSIDDLTFPAPTLDFHLSSILQKKTKTLPTMLEAFQKKNLSKNSLYG